MANLTATAAVLYEIKKPLVIEEVELLEPGPHEVQVRWVANGVCHSDYHLMSGDSPHPLPVVLGHEAAGVVEKIGGWSSPCSPATTCAELHPLVRQVRLLHQRDPDALRPARQAPLAHARRHVRS